MTSDRLEHEVIKVVIVVIIFVIVIIGRGTTKYAGSRVGRQSQTRGRDRGLEARRVRLKMIAAVGGQSIPASNCHILSTFRSHPRPVSCGIPTFI